MHVAGIIAEYNPFHEGHLYLIRKIREELGADTPIVIIMSGEFVQRGEPAIIDRRSRTSAVLSCGADLVLELPFTFACASADRFAHGAVQSLLATKIVTDLYFGAEHTSLSDLSEIARLDFEHDSIFLDELDRNLREGLPYAAAWEASARSVLVNKSDCSLDEDTFTSILREPNNLLAIAYLREIIVSGSTLTPHLVARNGSYHELSLSAEHLPSASAIRHEVLSQHKKQSHGEWLQSLGTLAPYLPASMLAEMLHLWNTDSQPMGPDDLLTVALPILRSMGSDELAEYAYMGNGLAAYLKNTMAKLHYNPALSLSELFQKDVSTRCFSSTRIMRALSSLVTGQKASDLQLLTEPVFLRLLGFSERGRLLLKEMRTAIDLPIFSRASDALHHSKNSHIARMDELDRISHDFWTFHARGTWEEDFHQDVIQFKRNRLYR